MENELKEITSAIDRLADLKLLEIYFAHITDKEALKMLLSKEKKVKAILAR